MKAAQRIALELALLIIALTFILCVNLKFNPHSTDLIIPSSLGGSIDSKWPTHLFHKQPRGPSSREWDFELEHAEHARIEDLRSRQKIAGRIQDTIRLAREREMNEKQGRTNQAMRNGVAVKSPRAKAAKQEVKWGHLRRQESWGAAMMED